MENAAYIHCIQGAYYLYPAQVFRDRFSPYHQFDRYRLKSLDRSADSKVLNSTYFQLMDDSGDLRAFPWDEIPFYFISQAETRNTLLESLC